MNLTASRYGKSRIRLVKVRREREPHDIVDLTIDVQLEGAFDAVATHEPYGLIEATIRRD